MSGNNLSVLSSPGFPQALTHFVDRVSLIAARAADEPCSWESPESSWGACDGGIPCHEAATVHNLCLDQPFCLRHHRAVSRG
jgi:hypothetical protein